ncbi:hypothetical protein K2173_023229 [Erythroxylum novogranatense]|uniref:Uncharacterized protein n=1 Tax=Erythroxylum novogranatense TaxID=1862640 RepID=A0AAV8T9M3_9ROSI|nr:hypothetical protein K2173_023229 [Erythroxylum novogranatense]
MPKTPMSLCLQFLVGWIVRNLKKGRYSQYVGTRAPIYLAAVLEYLVVEICFSCLESDVLELEVRDTGFCHYLTGGFQFVAIIS